MFRAFFVCTVLHLLYGGSNSNSKRQIPQHIKIKDQLADLSGPKRSCFLFCNVHSSLPYSHRSVFDSSWVVLVLWIQQDNIVWLNYIIFGWRNHGPAFFAPLPPSSPVDVRRPTTAALSAKKLTDISFYVMLGSLKGVFQDPRVDPKKWIKVFQIAAVGCPIQ